jgi:uncharacterized protein YutD
MAVIHNSSCKLAQEGYHESLYIVVQDWFEEYFNFGCDFVVDFDSQSAP